MQEHFPFYSEWHPFWWLLYGTAKRFNKYFFRDKGNFTKREKEIKKCDRCDKNQ